MLCIGYHPWFTHWISLDSTLTKEAHYTKLLLGNPDLKEPQDFKDDFDRLFPLLPEPTPLESILSDLRRNLEAFPHAMVGEVGIDKQARIAMDYEAYPRVLTPFTIPMEHQLAVLRAQLDLAIELGRNVSLHSVKAPKPTLDLLDGLQEKHGDRWTRISLDLHSCGFSPETLKSVQKKRPNIFLSLSTAINGRSPNHRALIAASAPNRIFVESDIHKIDQCAYRTWDMVCTVAEVRGWIVESSWEDNLQESEWGVVRRLEENWRLFREAKHDEKLPKKKPWKNTAKV